MLFLSFKERTISKKKKKKRRKKRDKSHERVKPILYDEWDKMRQEYFDSARALVGPYLNPEIDYDDYDLIPTFVQITLHRRFVVGLCIGDIAFGFSYKFAEVGEPTKDDAINVAIAGAEAFSKALDQRDEMIQAYYEVVSDVTDIPVEYFDYYRDEDLMTEFYGTGPTRLMLGIFEEKPSEIEKLPVDYIQFKHRSPQKSYGYRLDDFFHRGPEGAPTLGPSQGWYLEVPVINSENDPELAEKFERFRKAYGDFRKYYSRHLNPIELD